MSPDDLQQHMTVTAEFDPVLDKELRPEMLEFARTHSGRRFRWNVARPNLPDSREHGTWVMRLLEYNTGAPFHWTTETDLHNIQPDNNPTPLDGQWSDRGFYHWPAIDTTYGHLVKVYESSAADEDCVWLRIHKGDEDVSGHLTLDMAKAVHAQLGAWITAKDTTE